MTTAKFNIIIPPQDIQCNPECLQQIAEGDSKAFEWLYKNYCNKLYNYILLLTTDSFLSEDIVQEVFLKIWVNKEKLITVTNFNSYLYMSAKNLLLDKRRKQGLEKEYIKNFASGQTEQNGFYHRNEEQTINSAIKALSPRQQLVYKMIREEGGKREEVSRELNITPNTVKVTMQNALSNLRKKLCES
jgi:RNA polymerase sigma-70 factor (ECF subfamily)